MLCPSNSAPHALPWGSAEFLGLGFSVFLSIILCERFGSPIMKSTSVVLGLFVGCIIAADCGYFDKSSIDIAPVASFIWVKTFPLSVYGPLVLPLLAVYLVIMMESIGDVTASCEASRLQVDGALFDSRIQGGVLADGMLKVPLPKPQYRFFFVIRLFCLRAIILISRPGTNGLLAGLCTITPMSTFAQNNGVIALTRCANRKAGYAACFFLIIMGIFSKFAAALVAIPSSVLGGMTTFLFSSVAISGIRIISTVPFTRRTRFILTAAMSLGFGASLVPTYFSWVAPLFPHWNHTNLSTRYVFTYTGSNKAKQGFFDAIVLVMETGFAVTGFLAMILNIVIQEEVEEEDVTESLIGDDERRAEENVVASRSLDTEDASGIEK